MVASIAADDLEVETVPGRHFGQALRPGEPTGYESAVEVLLGWLAGRFELAPAGR